MQHILNLPEHLLPRRAHNHSKPSHKKAPLNPKSQSIAFHAPDHSKKYDSKVPENYYGMYPEVIYPYPSYPYPSYQPSHMNYIPYYPPGLQPNFQIPQYSPYGHGQQRSGQPSRGGAHFQVPMMVVPPPQVPPQEDTKNQQYYGGIPMNVNLSVNVNYGQHLSQNVAIQPNSAGLPTQSGKRARIGSLQENQRGRL